MPNVLLHKPCFLSPTLVASNVTCNYKNEFTSIEDRCCVMWRIGGKGHKKNGYMVCSNIECPRLEAANRIVA